MYAKSYRNDPRMITAKYAGTDAKGRRFNRGESVFYYPKDRTIISGEAGRDACRAFNDELAHQEYIDRH